VEPDQALRFIVATYGTKHLGMLLAHLYSVSQSHPEAKTTVYWQEIPEREIAALRAAFPTCNFRRTDFDFTGHWIRRIAAKMLSWHQAVSEHEADDHLILADADTLVLRDLTSFLPRDHDVTFTWKPEQILVNTGVMLLKCGPQQRRFSNACAIAPSRFSNRRNSTGKRTIRPMDMVQQIRWR
jgi:hypothetical protein